MQCSRVPVPLRADIGRVRAAVDDDGIDGGNMSWIMEQQQSLQANAEKEVLEEELAASGTCLRAGGRLCVCVCVCVCAFSGGGGGDVGGGGCVFVHTCLPIFCPHSVGVGLLLRCFVGSGTLPPL